MPRWLIALLLSIWSLAATAADWPQYKFDAARTGNAPDEALSLPLTRVVAVQLPGPIYSSPAVAGIHVFIQDALGNVACIDRTANRAVWVTPIGGVANYSSPAVAGGKLFVGSSAGHLAVLDAASGKVLAKVPAEGGIIAAPAVVNDSVYALSFHGDLLKLDLQGKLVWTYDGGQAANEELAVVDGDILFLSGPADATNKAIPLQVCRVRDLGEKPQLKDRITFLPYELRALAKTEKMKGIHLRARFGEPFPGYTCRGNARYIREKDFVECVVDGQRTWYTGSWPFFNGPPGWRSEPVLGKDHLVVGGEDGRVYFFNATYPPGPGRAFLVKEPLWVFATGGAGQPNGGVCSTPAIAGGAVFFGGEDGVLYGLGSGPEVEVALATPALPPQALPGRNLKGLEWPTSGGDMSYGMVSPDTHVRPPFKVRWKTRILGAGAYNGVVVADGKVFAASTNGYLEALDADSGQVIWRSYHPQMELELLNDGPATYAEGKVLVLRRSTPKHEICTAGGLWCHDAETGKLLWRHRRPALSDTAGTPMGVAVWKGKVLGAWHKEKDVIQAAAFELNTGKQVWTQEFSGVLPPEAKGQVHVCQGCLGEGRWFFSASRAGAGVPMKKDAGFGGATLAVDPETGNLIWKDTQHCVVHAGGLNYAQGTLFVYETSLATHALDGATGKLLWSTGNGPWYLQPLTEVFLGSQGKHGYKGNYCVDKMFVNGFYFSNVGHSASALVATEGHEGNGKEVWRYCPLSRACSTPAIAYGRLYYCGNGEGVVYCFENAGAEAPGAGK